MPVGAAISLALDTSELWTPYAEDGVPEPDDAQHTPGEAAEYPYPKGAKPPPPQPGQSVVKDVGFGARSACNLTVSVMILDIAALFIGDHISYHCANINKFNNFGLGL